MLTPRLVHETKEPQPESARWTKLVLAQAGALYSINDSEILVAKPCSSRKTEESWGKRAKIHVTEVAKGKLQWREDFVSVERMFSQLEMRDFDGISAAFITRRHVAHFEWAETERARDFLHLAYSAGPPLACPIMQTSKVRRAGAAD